MRSLGLSLLKRCTLYSPLIFGFYFKKCGEILVVTIWNTLPPLFKLLETELFLF